MGGPVAAVLCLLAGALMSGFAQEASTIHSADLTESPLPPTSPPDLYSTHPHDSDASVSAAEGVTHKEELIEGDQVTDHHVHEDSSTVHPLDAITASPTMIKVLQKDTTDHTADSTNVEAREPTRPNLTQPSPTTSFQGMGDAMPETTKVLTVGPLHPSTAWAPGAENHPSTKTPTDSTQPEATSNLPHSSWVSAITTSQVMATTPTTAQATSSATPATATAHTTRTAVQGDPSGLEVGDNKDSPSFHAGSSSNPLFVMIVSVFTIMVVIVVVAVGFHRYKKRNRRTEFRRLQDLPMDDMMEDTPLSLYSY